jgi:2,4-dienoyl-CoA reductase-like NADH-dependent reductase (Old Yellow Enzyme family)
MPQLFDPIKIRGLEIVNRAWVSPMCQYSAVDGVVGAWHNVHLGSFATGGAGLIMAEATGVVPEGRISGGCPGIYNDAQVAAWKSIIAFVHSQGSKIGIQLAHSGRKGSTTIPGADHLIASVAEGGWQAVAPSAIAFEGYPIPHALSIEEIHTLTHQWGKAAENAVKAGFDLVEIHAAHGYLLHEFCSPLSNTRTDEYGGDFNGRTKFLKEVVVEVRNAIPEVMPLFVRISASDWTEGGWTIEESVKLSQELKALGVDLIDASSGGNVYDAKIAVGPGYQVQFAEKIKSGTRITTSAVGMITDPAQANEIISSGKADVVMIGRQMLRNPRWPLFAAHELGVEVNWPRQLARGKLS